MISKNLLVLLVYMIVLKRSVSLSDVNNTAVRSISDSPLLLKILQSVDAATSDEHLFDVTMKLLRSLCVCMGETLKEKERKKPFNEDKNNFLQSSDDARATDGKVLDLYTKIYNSTCFNLRQELATKLNKMHKTLLDQGEDLITNSTCGKKIEITTENVIRNKLSEVLDDTKSEQKNVLFKTLIETRKYHKYTITQYNLFKRPIPQLNSEKVKHSIIIIITLFPLQNKNNTDTYKATATVSDRELNDTLFTKSPVDIDIIDTRYGSQVPGSEENSKTIAAAECNLRSIYTFLVETERKKSTKVFKLIKRKGTIKIYVDVVTMRNHTDYSSICCNSNIDKIKCQTDLIKTEPKSKETTEFKNSTETKSYKDTITKIKYFVKMYRDSQNQNVSNSSIFFEAIKPTTAMNEQMRSQTQTPHHKTTDSDNTSYTDDFTLNRTHKEGKKSQTGILSIKDYRDKQANKVSGDSLLSSSLFDRNLNRSASSTTLYYNRILQSPNPKNQSGSLLDIEDFMKNTNSNEPIDSSKILRAIQFGSSKVAMITSTLSYADSTNDGTNDIINTKKPKIPQTFNTTATLHRQDKTKKHKNEGEYMPLMLNTIPTIHKQDEPAWEKTTESYLNKYFQPNLKPIPVETHNSFDVPNISRIFNESSEHVAKENKSRFISYPDSDKNANFSISNLEQGNVNLTIGLHNERLGNPATSLMNSMTSINPSNNNEYTVTKIQETHPGPFINFEKITTELPPHARQVIVQTIDYTKPNSAPQKQNTGKPQKGNKIGNMIDTTDHKTTENINSQYLTSEHDQGTLLSVKFENVHEMKESMFNKIKIETNNVGVPEEQNHGDDLQNTKLSYAFESENSSQGYTMVHTGDNKIDINDQMGLIKQEFEGKYFTQHTLSNEDATSIHMPEAHGTFGSLNTTSIYATTSTTEDTAALDEIDRTLTSQHTYNSNSTIMEQDNNYVNVTYSQTSRVSPKVEKTIHIKNNSFRSPDKAYFLTTSNSNQTVNRSIGHVLPKKFLLNVSNTNANYYTKTSAILQSNNQHQINVTSLNQSTKFSEATPYLQRQSLTTHLSLISRTAYTPTNTIQQNQIEEPSTTPYHLFRKMPTTTNEDVIMKHSEEMLSSVRDANKTISLSKGSTNRNEAYQPTFQQGNRNSSYSKEEYVEEGSKSSNISPNLNFGNTLLDESKNVDDPNNQKSYHNFNEHYELRKPKKTSTAQKTDQIKEKHQSQKQAYRESTVPFPKSEFFNLRAETLPIGDRTMENYIQDSIPQKQAKENDFFTFDFTLNSDAVEKNVFVTRNMSITNGSTILSPATQKYNDTNHVRLGASDVQINDMVTTANRAMTNFTDEIHYLDRNHNSTKSLIRTSKQEESANVKVFDNLKNFTHRNILPNITTMNFELLHSNIVSSSKQQTKRLVGMEKIDTDMDNSLVLSPSTESSFKPRLSTYYFIESDNQLGEGSQESKELETKSLVSTKNIAATVTNTDKMIRFPDFFATPSTPISTIFTKNSEKTQELDSYLNSVKTLPMLLINVTSNTVGIGMKTLPNELDHKTVQLILGKNEPRDTTEYKMWNYSNNIPHNLPVQNIRTYKQWPSIKKNKENIIHNSKTITTVVNSDLIPKITSPMAANIHTESSFGTPTPKGMEIIDKPSTKTTKTTDMSTYQSKPVTKYPLDMAATYTDDIQNVTCVLKVVTSSNSYISAKNTTGVSVVSNLSTTIPNTSSYAVLSNAALTNVDVSYLTGTTADNFSNAWVLKQTSNKMINAPISPTVSITSLNKIDLENRKIKTTVPVNLKNTNNQYFGSAQEKLLQKHKEYTTLNSKDRRTTYALPFTPLRTNELIIEHGAEQMISVVSKTTESNTIATETNNLQTRYINPHSSTYLSTPKSYEEQRIEEINLPVRRFSNDTTRAEKHTSPPSESTFDVNVSLYVNCSTDNTVLQNRSSTLILNNRDPNKSFSKTKVDQKKVLSGLKAKLINEKIPIFLIEDVTMSPNEDVTISLEQFDEISRNKNIFTQAINNNPVLSTTKRMPKPLKETTKVEENALTSSYINKQTLTPNNASKFKNESSLLVDTNMTFNPVTKTSMLSILSLKHKSTGFIGIARKEMQPIISRSKLVNITISLPTAENKSVANIPNILNERTILNTNLPISFTTKWMTPNDSQLLFPSSNSELLQKNAMNTEGKTKNRTVNFEKTLIMTSNTKFSPSTTKSNHAKPTSTRNHHSNHIGLILKADSLYKQTIPINPVTSKFTILSSDSTDLKIITTESSHKWTDGIKASQNNDITENVLSQKITTSTLHNKQSSGNKFDQGLHKIDFTTSHQFSIATPTSALRIFRQPYELHEIFQNETNTHSAEYKNDIDKAKNKTYKYSNFANILEKRNEMLTTARVTVNNPNTKVIFSSFINMDNQSVLLAKEETTVENAEKLNIYSYVSTTPLFVSNLSEHTNNPEKTTSAKKLQRESKAGTPNEEAEIVDGDKFTTTRLKNAYSSSKPGTKQILFETKDINIALTVKNTKGHTHLPSPKRETQLDFHKTQTNKNMSKFLPTHAPLVSVTKTSEKHSPGLDNTSKMLTEGVEKSFIGKVKNLRQKDISKSLINQNIEKTGITPRANLYKPLAFFDLSTEGHKITQGNKNDRRADDRISSSKQLVTGVETIKIRQQKFSKEWLVLSTAKPLTRNRNKIVMLNKIATTKKTFRSEYFPTEKSRGVFIDKPFGFETKLSDNPTTTKPHYIIDFILTNPFTTSTMSSPSRTRAETKHVTLIEKTTFTPSILKKHKSKVSTNNSLSAYKESNMSQKMTEAISTTSLEHTSIPNVLVSWNNKRKYSETVYAQQMNSRISELKKKQLPNVTKEAKKSIEKNMTRRTYISSKNIDEKTGSTANSNTERTDYSETNTGTRIFVPSFDSNENTLFGFTRAYKKNTSYYNITKPISKNYAGSPLAKYKNILQTKLTNLTHNTRPTERLYNIHSTSKHNTGSPKILTNNLLSNQNHRYTTKTQAVMSKMMINKSGEINEKKYVNSNKFTYTKIFGKNNTETNKIEPKISESTLRTTKRYLLKQTRPAENMKRTKFHKPEKNTGLKENVNYFKQTESSNIRKVSPKMIITKDISITTTEAKIIRYNTYKPTADEDFYISKLETRINLFKKGLKPSNYKNNTNNQGPIKIKNTTSCALLRQLSHHVDQSLKSFIELVKVSNCSVDIILPKKQIVQQKNLFTTGTNFVTIKPNKIKKNMLDPFAKTHLYPIKIVTPKKLRKVMRRIQIGGKNKEILTMNTGDFFAQRRLVTQRNNINDVFRIRPDPINYLPTKAPSHIMILRPKFEKIDKARANFRPKPLIIANKDNLYRDEANRQGESRKSLSWRDKASFLQDVISKGRRRSQNSGDHSVLARPYVLTPSTKPKFLRDRVDSIRSYLVNADYVKSTTKNEYFMDLEKQDSDDTDYDDSMHRILPIRRNFWIPEKLETTTSTTSTRRLRKNGPKRTIFFLSPTVPYNRYF